MAPPSEWPTHIKPQADAMVKQKVRFSIKTVCVQKQFARMCADMAKGEGKARLHLANFAVIFGHIAWSDSCQISSR